MRNYDQPGIHEAYSSNQTTSDAAEQLLTLVTAALSGVVGFFGTKLVGMGLDVQI